MVCPCGPQAHTLAGCSKRPSSKAAGSPATEAYPWGTLQGYGRLRTLLEDFFSILLTNMATAANKAPNRELAPYNKDWYGVRHLPVRPKLARA